jgi:hypothetical protein
LASQDISATQLQLNSIGTARTDGFLLRFPQGASSVSLRLISDLPVQIALVARFIDLMKLCLQPV